LEHRAHGVLAQPSSTVGGVARANTAVGVSLKISYYTEWSIPAVAIVWRPALAVWLDSTLCPGGCQRVIRKRKKRLQYE
jgi:hypothetical protein